MRALITGLIEQAGYAVTAVEGLVPAAKALAGGNFALCLLDMHLPDGNGLQLLESLNSHKPPIPAIIITAFGDTPTAVESLKRGAENFIDKPIDPALLHRAIEDALSSGSSRPGGEGSLPPALVGNGAAVRELRRACLQRRNSRAPAFVTGPRRGGHRQLIDYLRKGDRASATAIDSAAFEDDAQEQWRELIGALLRPARAAEVGSVIVDDLAKIPGPVWEQFARTIMRLADSDAASAQARLIVLGRGPKITSQIAKPCQGQALALLAALEPYRLDIPPLAERIDDGEALMNALLARHVSGEAAPQLRYTGKTRRWLSQFAQINELEDLDDFLRQFINSWPADSQSGEFSVPNLSEQDFILLKTLDRFRWNRTKAAGFLGLSLRQIRYRLEKIGSGSKKDGDQ